MLVTPSFAFFARFVSFLLAILIDQSNLARIMHKFSTAVPQSSALTAFHFLALLDVLNEYSCGALRREPYPARRLRHFATKTMKNPG